MKRFQAGEDRIELVGHAGSLGAVGHRRAPTWRTPRHVHRAPSRNLVGDGDWPPACPRVP